MGDQIWTLVDGRVAACWPQVFSLVSPFLLTLNEHSKSLASVAKIIEAWKDRGRPKRWQIVGGGIISDVAAFAAALVGAEFDLVPTTLLAMVDACVGGKTGVNFPPFGKNQVGAWAFPREVRVWSPWLSTLPERELRSGAVESLKHAFLLGNLGLAKDLTSDIIKPASGSLEPLLEPLISCKAAIVERDPAEEGERAVLNLGHTLGHALEGYALEKSQDEQNILHGEAVAFGLVYALLLSEKVAGLPSRLCRGMIAHIQEASGCLNRSHLIGALREPDLTAQHVFEHLLHFMGMDKKNLRGHETRWVLLSEVGQVYRVGEAWTTSVPLPILYETWKQLVTSLPDNH
jgi:3-dehydroquinate synthase